MRSPTQGLPNSERANLRDRRRIRSFNTPRRSRDSKHLRPKASLASDEDGDEESSPTKKLRFADAIAEEKGRDNLVLTERQVTPIKVNRVCVETIQIGPDCTTQWKVHAEFYRGAWSAVGNSFVTTTSAVLEDFQGIGGTSRLRLLPILNRADVPIPTSTS
jgi:hypothetical protein